MNIHSIYHLLAQAAGKISANEVNIPPLDPVKVLVGVLNAVYFAAGVTAVIVIILSGYSFASSSYDPAKVANAKNALLYSVVGLIVVMMAFAITQFLAGRF